jgi:hypothetical protein
MCFCLSCATWSLGTVGTGNRKCTIAQKGQKGDVRGFLPSLHVLERVLACFRGAGSVNLGILRDMATFGAR